MHCPDSAAEVLLAAAGMIILAVFWARGNSLITLSLPVSQGPAVEHRSLTKEAV